MRYLLFAILFFLIGSPAHPVMAEDIPVYLLTIKNHRFEPSTVAIPADTKVKLLIKNLDSSAEEFESHDFSREKIIPGNSEAPVFVGPLGPGTYKFFGEFHMDTAQGVVTVK